MQENFNNEKVIDNVNGEAASVELPENVTIEPQEEEHMHLKHISDSSSLVRAYLPVSDDQGQLLGDLDLERQVKEFCDRYKDLSAVNEPDPVIREAKELVTRYTLRVNFVENSLRGTITKYRIREGMLFNIMKELITQKDIKWMAWFKKNFNQREFRSVSDYMKLARMKNIIRYAVFGKERLIQLERQLSDEQKEQEDPIGAFLEENGIDFNPEQETDDRELRIEADIAINMRKLHKVEITEIPRELVEALVRNGRDLEKSHIEELKRAQQVPDKDVVEYMKTIIDKNGKPEPIMTPARKAEGFKKTADRFLKAVNTALGDREYVLQFDRGTYDLLKQKVLDLERLIQAN
ncbi:MAG: hypothetical protein P8Y80_09850 [Acidobacteriota bacterium]